MGKDMAFKVTSAGIFHLLLADCIFLRNRRSFLGPRFFYILMRIKRGCRYEVASIILKKMSTLLLWSC